MARRVVLDATVLINFGGVRRMAWLGLFEGTQIIAVREAVDEVRRLPERDEVEHAIESGLIHLHTLRSVPELTLFGAFVGQGLGRGEAATLAAAEAHGWQVGTDDRHARSLVLARRGRECLTGTLGLLITLVRAGAVSLDEADRGLRSMVARGYRSPVFDLRGFGDLLRERAPRYGT